MSNPITTVSGEQWHSETTTGRLIRPLDEREKALPPSDLRIEIMKREREEQAISEYGWPRPYSANHDRASYRTFGLPQFHTALELERARMVSSLVAGIAARGGNALDMVIALVRENERLRMKLYGMPWDSPVVNPETRRLMALGMDSKPSTPKQP